LHTAKKDDRLLNFRGPWNNKRRLTSESPFSFGDLKVADSKRTEGELLFERYLQAMNYPYEFEKEYLGRSKRPDYTVTNNGCAFLLDVKDFDPYLPLGGGYYDPYPRIREKINQGNDKFKEYKDFSCSIVLRNNGNALVDVEFPDIVLGAMYGDAGFTFPVNTTTGAAAGSLTRAFLGRGKMMIHSDNPQNKTISALITLRHVGVGMHRMRQIFRELPQLGIEESIAVARERYPNFDQDERQLGVIVWENAVARIPLSRDLFIGPYDERWGVDGDNQRVVFRGEKLAELKPEDN
jgi:hypothetical protein